MIHYIVGALIMIAGLVIRSIAIKQMGIFKLNLCKPDEIKTDGIYSVVRHPAYVGSVLFYAGLSIIEIHAAFIYLAFVFFLDRAIKEETLMPYSEYQSYSKKVGMFFPKFKKVA